MRHEDELSGRLRRGGNSCVSSLWRRLRRRGQREEGAVAVIVAFAMTALLSMAALSVDIGMAYTDAAAAQNAADVAALAAAQQLPVAVDDADAAARVVATAREYLAKNGFEAEDDCQIRLEDAYNGSYTTIDVELATTTDTAFARVFGVEQIQLSRGAAAGMRLVGATSGAVPISVESSALELLLEAGEYEHIVLKYGSKTDAVVNGAFGALEIDGQSGGGASQYEYYLTYGYDSLLSVGDRLPVKTGNMSGPTYDGISTRYWGCDHFVSDGGCTAEHYVDSCPRLLTVPVVETVGKHRVEVDGFAIFILEDIDTYYNRSYVVGTYLSTVIGNAYGASFGQAGDYGAYTLQLIR